ncbi:MAG: Spy/CpxP family protein refolding chaperone [bacterium]
MSKKVILIILIVSVAINFATLCTFGYFWWTRHHQEGPFRFGPPDHIKNWGKSGIVQELGLTQEQIEEIHRMREEMEKDVDSLRMELFKKRRELMNILKQSEVNETKVDSIISKITSLQAKHEKTSFKNFQYIRDILTPEQRGKLGELLHMALEEHKPPHLPGNMNHLPHPDLPHPPNQPPPPLHGR